MTLTTLIKTMGLSAEEKDDYQDLVVDWEAVLQRLHSHPQEAAIQCTNNDLPLDIALTIRATPFPPDAAKALINANPEALDFYGFVNACSNPQISGDTMKVLVDSKPCLITERSCVGNVALHRTGNMEVARVLIEAYPEGLSVKNVRGHLPLHRQVQSPHENSPEMVRILLEEGIRRNVGSVEGAGGLLDKDNREMTPLDHAFWRFKINKTKIDYNKLLTCFRVAGAATFREKFQNSDEIFKSSPLHAVIDFIDMMENSNNQQPFRLHYGYDNQEVVTSRQILEMVLYPIFLEKGILKEEDRFGRLPFQHARENGMTFETGLKEILDAYPEALVRDTKILDEKNLPHTLAQAATSEINTSFLVLSSMPEIFAYKTQ